MIQHLLDGQKRAAEKPAPARDASGDETIAKVEHEEALAAQRKAFEEILAQQQAGFEQQIREVTRELKPMMRQMVAEAMSPAPSERVNGTKVATPANGARRAPMPAPSPRPAPSTTLAEEPQPGLVLASTVRDQRVSPEAIVRMESIGALLTPEEHAELEEKIRTASPQQLRMAEGHLLSLSPEEAVEFLRRTVLRRRPS